MVRTLTRGALLLTLAALPGCGLVSWGTVEERGPVPVGPGGLLGLLPPLVVPTPDLAEGVAAYTSAVRVGLRQDLAPGELFLELRRSRHSPWWAHAFVAPLQMASLGPDLVLGLPLLAVSRDRLRLLAWDRYGEDPLAEGTASVHRWLIGTVRFLYEVALEHRVTPTPPDLGAALRDLEWELASSPDSPPAARPPARVVGGCPPCESAPLPP